MKFIKSCLAALLTCVVVSSAHTAQIQSQPETKGRIGNWYYISGTDKLFQVPRFVGAVHDNQARTSLIFTCQGRPGAAADQKSAPIVSMMLSDPIGRPGATTLIKMRLD